MPDRPAPKAWILKSLDVAVLLALCVVMLGAYTRLTNAGLGCPDWPLCYGNFVPAKTLLNQDISISKAWTEMAHRYLAGTLALLVFLIGFALIKTRKNRYWVLTIMALLLAQAALGMWTVTLKLLPIVVMGHLLGGMLIFALLCCLRLHLSGILAADALSFRPWIVLGLILLLVQIALGGWVSANYAGIACIGFPKCNGQWIPALVLNDSFHMLSPIGVNYQGGVMEAGARVTIQFIHRVGALIAGGYVMLLSLFMYWKTSSILLRTLACLVFFLVFLQWCLGIINVTYLLPLPVAVLHNGVAALLLATLMMILYLSPRRVKT